MPGYFHWPAGWPGGRLLNIVMVTILIHLVVSFITLIVFHTYARCLYTASHVIGLSLIVCVLLVTHHCTEIQDMMGLSKSAFRKLQVLENTALLSCCCCLSIVYSLLFARCVHANKDYLLSFLWAYVDTALLFYLLVVSADTSEDQAQYSDVEMNRTTSWKIVIQQITVGLIFFSSQLFAIFLFVSAAYHSVASFHNLRHREIEVITVNVTKHNSLALQFRCEGKGELIVIEQDIGGRTSISWNSLPKLLVMKGLRVCVYDRPGAGDSEGYDTDFIGSARNPLWSEQNVPFLQSLLKSWNATKPYYLLGHGYGGHHIAFSAIGKQETVKGLIFLDSSAFTQEEDLPLANTSQYNLDLLCRFQPSGIVRLLSDAGVISLPEITGDMYDYSAMTPKTRHKLNQDIMSDTTFCSIRREYQGYITKSKKMLHYLSRQTTYIYSKVLIIDRHYRQYWLPNHMFPYFNRSSNYIQIPSSDHFSIFYRTKFADQVAGHVYDFVKAGMSTK